MPPAWDESTMDVNFAAGTTSFDSFSSMNGLVQDLDRFDIDKVLTDSGLHLDELVQAPNGPPLQLKGPPTGELKTHAPRKRKGRLLADLTVDGPETVYEDSDSHHSWTAADNAEEWVTRLRASLTAFRRDRDRVALITTPLQTRQRRKVHSMANIWGLSHMSIGPGREKRMIVCKGALTGSTSRMPVSTGRRWNPCDTWSAGFVNTRVVVFDMLDPNMDSFHVSNVLQGADIAAPLKTTMDYYEMDMNGFTISVAKAFAIFASSEDAAMALLALDGTTPNWNSFTIEGDYVRFPAGFNFNDALLDAFDTLPEAIRLAQVSAEESKRDRAIATGSAPQSESDSDDDTLHSSSLAIARRAPYDGPSAASSLSMDAGYASAGSARSAAISDHSDTSTSRKRKRVPKVAGGFPCRDHGCDKIFDRAGDRTKHEKYHSEGRPNVCTRCGKGFHFPKDLRRHMIVHSGLPTQDAGEQSMPVTIAGARRYSGNEMLHPASCSPPLSESHLKRLYNAGVPSTKRRSSRSTPLE